MSNQRYDTGDSGKILFSYKVPDSWYQRQLNVRFIWIFALLAAGFWWALAAIFGKSTLASIFTLILMYATMLLRNRVMKNLVVAIQGSTSGLQFQSYNAALADGLLLPESSSNYDTNYDAKLDRMAWCDVKSLERRKRSRLTLQNGTVLNLSLIPAEILDQLVMILQETSNARITGS